MFLLAGYLIRHKSNRGTSGPTKVRENFDYLRRVQLRCLHLSRKNYGQLRQNQYAHEQAAIL
jgi:hypothetical protein